MSNDDWRKSSHSDANGECVELKLVDGGDSAGS
jgi:hypothetical protein